MLNILREKRSIEEAIFILITDDSFPFNEAAKAAFLKINGIISENLREKSVMFQLNDLIRRYKNLNDQRKFTRIVPNNYEQFKLVFTHPQQRYLVSGFISDISLEGSNFIPNNPSLTSDLTVNQKIPNCSLRVGEEIITVSCRIARKNRELGIEFESFEQEGHQKLFKYLMERPERDMKHHRRRDS